MSRLVFIFAVSFTMTLMGSSVFLDNGAEIPAGAKPEPVPIEMLYQEEPAPSGPEPIDVLLAGSKSQVPAKFLRAFDERVQIGDVLRTSTAEDLFVGGRLVLPAGSEILGRIETVNLSYFGDRAEIGIRFFLPLSPKTRVVATGSSIAGEHRGLTILTMEADVWTFLAPIVPGDTVVFRLE